MEGSTPGAFKDYAYYVLYTLPCYTTLTTNWEGEVNLVRVIVPSFAGLNRQFLAYP